MHTTENETKALELKEKILKDKRYLEIDDIESWITNRISILKVSGTKVDDPG